MTYFIVADGDNVGSHLKALDLELMTVQSQAISKAISEISIMALGRGAKVHVAGGDDLILECNDALSAMCIMTLISDHFEWSTGLNISIAISEKLTTALTMLEASKQLKM